MKMYMIFKPKLLPKEIVGECNEVTLKYTL